jgi:flagellar protein FliS
MTTYTSTAYRTSSVLTASSGQLIVMLYDGARRFLSQASIAMADKRVSLAHAKLRRAELILRHLRNTTDLEQGEIAHNLVGLYEFYLRQCTQARLDQDPAIIDRVNGMLGQLRDSWSAIADLEPAAPVVAEPAAAGAPA